jgi:hypothetical protein
MTIEQNKSPPPTLPFRVSSFEINADGDHRVIMGADNFSIAQLMDRLPEENHQLAEYIVRACNSHDELMNALIRLVSAISVAEELAEIESGLFIESLDQARVAIAKARGQQ